MSGMRLGSSLDEYSRKYRHISLSRQGGILEVKLHSNGGSLVWAPRVHEELGFCFNDIAHDPDTEVVILTGEGDTFCSELDRDAFLSTSIPTWAPIHLEGRRLINNLLDIGVPVIGVVNGPAHIHAEILLLSDIVVAANTASFSDPIHFPAGWVPGDGVHVFWPAVLGRTRASYFLLMGETIYAEDAKALGLVNEVVAPAVLQARSREIAEQILQKPPLVRRYSRALMTQEIKRLMHAELSHGLALEGLAFMEEQASAS